MDQQESSKRRGNDDNFSLRYEVNVIQGELTLQQITPVKFILWKFILFIISNVIIFAPALIAYWHANIRRFLYYEYCSLKDCTHFYIINHDSQGTIVKRQTKKIMINQNKSKEGICFINRYVRYIIDDDESVRMSCYNYQERLDNILMEKLGQRIEEKGLSQSQVEELRDSYGIGTRVIHKESSWFLLFHELIKPIYIWIILSLAYVYFLAKYYVLGAAFTIILFRGLYLTLGKRIRQINVIIDKNYYTVEVNVMREGEIKPISSVGIVPGDIVFLKEAIKLPFQALILQGGLIMDEKQLNGDSFYCFKQSYLSKAENKIKIDKRSEIYEGTELIQVRINKKMRIFEQYRQQYGVPVLVIRTNFLTARAQLTRMQIFPKQPKNSMERQAGNYLVIQLSICACFYLTFIIINFSHVGYNYHFLRRFFDLWIMSNPISVVSSMLFGIEYTVQKLKEKKIFCGPLHKIIDGGLIDICCFDRHGTLIKDEKKFRVLIPSHNGTFEKALLNRDKDIKELNERSKEERHLISMLTNMGSNHSLIKLYSTNALIGDNIQQALMKFGRFNMIMPSSSDQREFMFYFQRQRGGHYGYVYRRYEMNSNIHMSTVICEHNFNKDQYEVCTKGYPEDLLNVMRPDTVPPNYLQIFREYTSKGYSGLSLASKTISKTTDLYKLSRHQVQVDLQFNGFIFFSNEFKQQTIETIVKLQAASIKSIMITRDNPYTACNLSYKCNISSQQKETMLCDFNNNIFVLQKVNSYNKISSANHYLMDKYLNNNMEQSMFVQQLANPNKSFSIIKKQSSSKRRSLTQHHDIFQKIMQSDCNLCITAQALNQLFPNHITTLSKQQRSILESITVVSKAHSEQKIKIVKVLQLLDKKVAMIGNNCHDHRAFRQADVGLIFSNSQATISAHFTSGISNISCVVELIKQCRAGIASNITIFNTVVLFATLEYTSTIICNRFLQFPGDFQYLYWDVGISFFFCNICIATNQTAETLTPEKPNPRLLSFTRLLQILSAFAIHFIGHVTMIAVYVYIEPQFYGVAGGVENNVRKFYGKNEYGFKSGIQSNILFAIVNNFYLAVIIGFNVNQPWKKHFLSSITIVVFLMVFGIYNLFIIFWEAVTYVEFFNSQYIAKYYDRWIIFAVSYSFSAFIIINQKLIMLPLSNYLIKKYPHIKWI